MNVGSAAPVPNFVSASALPAQPAAPVRVPNSSLATIAYEPSPAYQQFFASGLAEEMPKQHVHGWWCRHFVKGGHKVQPRIPSKAAIATMKIRELDVRRQCSYNELRTLHGAGQRCLDRAKQALRVNDMHVAKSAVMQYIKTLARIKRAETNQINIENCEDALSSAINEMRLDEITTLAINAVASFGISAGQVQAKQEILDGRIAEVQFNGVESSSQDEMSGQVAEILSKLSADLQREQQGRLVQAPNVQAQAPVAMPPVMNATY